MTIEFNCQQCESLLRVPAEAAGQDCQCPSCNAIIKVPDEDILDAEIVDAEIVEEEPSAADQRITVECPHCGKPLTCSADLLGTKGQCVSCRQIFTISHTPIKADATAFVFHCPKCNQLFDGNESMRGRRGKCHVCGEVFAIELEPVTAPEPEPIPAPAPPPPPVQQSGNDAIQLACGACDGIMEVPASAAGATAECPFCQALLEIPHV